VLDKFKEDDGEYLKELKKYLRRKQYESVEEKKA
jgi:hypothetical protein